MFPLKHLFLANIIYFLLSPAFNCGKLGPPTNGRLKLSNLTKVTYTCDTYYIEQAQDIALPMENGLRASKMADQCTNNATQSLYLREEPVLRKKNILNQAIAALR